MPLKKIALKPGVNRENTRYTNEGGWYESDKIRFRQGTPEKIGGWQRISGTTFLGICRSLWNWVTLGGVNLIGVGTNLKFYLESGGAYNDITPIRDAVALTNPFETTNGSPIVEVTDASGGYIDGDYVAFYPAVTLNGITIYGQYQLTISGANTYTIDTGTLKNGKQVTGRLVETSGDTDVVATSPTNPLADHVRINKKDVENVRPSRVSSMPDGLLNTLTQDDVLDLLSYMLGQ